MERQICRVCLEDKEIECFELRKDTGKYRGQCFDCRKELRTKYVKEGPKYKRPPENDNTTTRKCDQCEEVKPLSDYSIRADSGKRRYSCDDCRHAYCRNFKNSEEYKARERERRKSDPLYALEMRYRSRVHSVCSYIVNNTKPVRLRHSLDFLGCDIAGFKKHIDDQFQPGMSWKEPESFVLDHIIPIAWFDLNDPAHQDICFHYTNFQPLTAEQNAKKSDNIVLEYITQPLLDRIPDELRNRLFSENTRKKRTIRSQAS